MALIKVKASTPMWVEGVLVEICNTCSNPVNKPYRYKDHKNRERGCVSSCHDKYVARNTKPNWMSPRMVLPDWITKARRGMPMFERFDDGKG